MYILNNNTSVLQDLLLYNCFTLLTRLSKAKKNILKVIDELIIQAGLPLILSKLFKGI